MIKADRSYKKNGVVINEFLISSHSEYCAAAPKKIVVPRSIIIYSFPDIPIKSYISLAEFYSRQVYYNRFRGFIPNYFVDSAAAWHLLKNNLSEKIIVVKCGASQKAEDRVKALCSMLSKQYNIEVKDVIDEIDYDTALAEEPIEITSMAAQCTFEVYVDNKWQQPIKGRPIRAIKININEGELYYRTHLINGGWLDWVGNNEISGSLSSFIDGFQIKYISNKNAIQYRFSTINSKLISWRSSNIQIPTKHYIDNFEFRIKEGF